MELCDKGLNGTLQRTKDGATAESRIQELAGAPNQLVLTKCVASVLLGHCVSQMVQDATSEGSKGACLLATEENGLVLQPWSSCYGAG